MAHYAQDTQTPNFLTNTHIHTSFFVLIFWVFSPPSFAEPISKTEDQALQNHIDLIEVALLTDSYNARCRGISIAKALNSVNRLYVTKYSLTANNFIKTYIDPDVKTLKIERKHRFNKMLNVLGGCQAAKSKDSIKRLKKHFKSLYETAEKSPWYPE